MSNKPFNFYVDGIEDAMMEALRSGVPYAGADQVRPYAGELDFEEINRESKAALQALVSHLPLYLVSYVDGQNRSDVPDLWLPGEPRTFDHDGTFTVVACSSGWRDNEDLPGVSKMLGDAVTALAGRTFTKAVTEPDPEDGGEEIEVGYQLNLTPLSPSPESPNPAFITRLDELTVYAFYFDTLFKYTVTPPAEEPQVITAINFEIDLRNRRGNREGLPGVLVK
jgi:hypothetical protein